LDKDYIISIVQLSALEESQRLKSAYLVMESLPTYYNVDGIEEPEMAAAVAHLIGKPGSEIERGFAALCGDNIVGILSFIPGQLLPRARLIGAQALIRLLPSESAQLFRNHLRGYDAGFGRVPDQSLYLARFAIERHLRGSGLAAEMMNVYLSVEIESEAKPDFFTLHVDKENERAIAFYRKYKFLNHFQGPRYMTMIRNSDDA
jgi:ribosomal protein S18 acetylase RimI-like enzyme